MVYTLNWLKLEFNWSLSASSVHWLVGPTHFTGWNYRPWQYTKPNPCNHGRPGGISRLCCAKACLFISYGRNNETIFTKYCRGLGVPPNLKNLPVGQESPMFKTVQMGNYWTDGRQMAHLFCAWRGLYQQHKNLGFEKSKMAERCSTGFLTCGRISMSHAHPFVTIVSDRRMILPANDFLLEECTDCTLQDWERETPKVRLRELTMVNEYAPSWILMRLH